MTDPSIVLKQYFGHDAFRGGQRPLVDAILAGRDVLGVMPTGVGKSICYQLPALMLPGMTVVVSPLISLMKDQVASLRNSGIPSAFINSSLTPEEYAQTLQAAFQGLYKLLYVAPERLTAQGFLRLAGSVSISLVAVDEAHCVSQWGQDFRPSYLNIRAFIEQLPERPVVAAFTATATDAVKDDVEKLLGLRDPLRVTTGFDRPNLFFDVVRPSRKGPWLLEFLARHRDQSGIVYCATRKSVEEVCAKLLQEGFSATRYHAGLTDEERRRNQEDFVYDRCQVMVATNAFGMGIDKSNVGFVVHYNMPKNIESYYQEAGRAGRDGSRAECVLLFSSTDVRTMRFLIDNSSENEALTEEERQAIRRQDLVRLDQMTAYCKTSGCLRAALLRYFGEDAPERCGNCGNCIAQGKQVDITLEAQKILSGVARIEKKYRGSVGLTLLVRMLHGSADQRVLKLGLDELPTYGVMRDTDKTKIREYVDRLIEAEYLTVTRDNYPVVRMTPRARNVLFDGERVSFLDRNPPREKERRRAKGGQSTLERNADGDSLYEALRDLRLRIAQSEGVPAYVVFTNATLADMAARRPGNLDEFKAVSGVGQYKASRYAGAFLEAIAEWERDRFRG